MMTPNAFLLVEFVNLIRYHVTCQKIHIIFQRNVADRKTDDVAGYHQMNKRQSQVQYRLYLQLRPHQNRILVSKRIRIFGGSTYF